MIRELKEPWLACGRLPLLALVALVFAGWAAPAQAASEGVFLDVIVNHRFFGAGEAPTLSVRTREAVKLNCLVYDAANRLVAHRAAENTGKEFTLALKDLPPVPKGVWLFCLVAADQAGQRVSTYPESPGGGEIIQVTDSKLDPERHQVSYVLPRAACVRLRAGFNEGLYLQPVISAEVQSAGPHTVAWDGAGQGGLFTNLYLNPSVRVSILALSLPANILAAENQPALRAEATPGPMSPAVPASLADLTRPPWVPQAGGGKSAEFLIADDYTLNLETVPDGATRTLEIRTDCAPANRGRLFNKRFELMLFLDTTFLVEDERSQLPYSYRMSTRGLSPGRHILTANVVDADSSVGTVSRELNIAQP